MSAVKYRNRTPVISFVEAEWIRKQVAAGARQSDMAKQFDVRASEISQIVNGKRFANDVEYASVTNQMRKAEIVMEEATAREQAFNARRRAQEEMMERDGSLKKYKRKPEHNEFDVRRKMQAERKKNEETLASLITQ